MWMNFILMIYVEYKTTYRFRIYSNKAQIKAIEYILYLFHKLYNTMLKQIKAAITEGK